MVSYKKLISFIWQFMRRQKWAFFLVFLLDGFAWPFETLVWPYILSVVIDTFTRFEMDRAAAWEWLQGPILGGISLVIFVEIASRLMGFTLAKAIPKLQSDIRMAMFDHIQQHTPHYFNERFSGSLANKMTDMTTQIETILLQLFWPIFPALMTCLLGSVVLWFINPLFTGIWLTWTIIHCTICIKFARSCDFYEQKHGESRSTLLGKIVDSFTNNFAVNLFYRFRYEKELIAPYQKEEKETNVEARYYVEKMRVILGIFYFGSNVLGIFGTLIYLWINYQITTGQVAQVFSMMWSFSTILCTVSTALPIFFQAFGTAKQAYSVMLDPQDLGDKPLAKDLLIRSGEIIFDNVSFYYGDKKLFQNKHAIIKSGEKVGLVGFTGAGKSTFISLILRFFPIQTGKILIDGQDIANVTLKSLRDQIALIPQDPVLFHRTIRENIAFGKPLATDDEIFRAAKLAHCDEFIQNIPKGYEAKIGERGTKISGGERQRIAIARAILRDSPILLLDEATSSLDSLTERFIQDSLEKLMQNRTSIVIAHRLSTLRRMDRILVFEHGKIVEEGAHTFLINKEGLYAKMWKMQVGGFLPDQL